MAQVKGEPVIVFTGQSYLWFVALGVAWGVGSWALAWLDVEGSVPASEQGLVFAVYGATGLPIFTGILWLRRWSLELTSAGLVLTARGSTRTVPWADLATVEVVMGGQWVRCRDTSRRVTLWMTTRRVYPRLSSVARRDNHRLADRLRVGVGRHMR